MGGSLGPVLANIIMTEFEYEIINNLINQGLIAFYCRYVDDTLLLIKRNTIKYIKYKHLRDCDNIKHIQDLYNLPDIFTNENTSSTTVINKEFFAQTVRDNTNIIDRDDNWNLLLYKEAYHIKPLSPFLNNGLKANSELRLFS